MSAVILLNSFTCTYCVREQVCVDRFAKSLHTKLAVFESDNRSCSIALWAKHLKGWCFFWNWPLSGLQGVEVCAGLLQSVPRSAAECVQGYRVCAGCSFNNLPCSSRFSQKIFYWKKNILYECVLKTKIIWKIDYFEDSILAIWNNVWWLCLSWLHLALLELSALCFTSPHW